MKEDGEITTHSSYTCIMCSGARDLTLLEACKHMLTALHRQEAAVRRCAVLGPSACSINVRSQASVTIVCKHTAASA